MKFPRSLTFAEKKVNFNTLEKFWKGLSAVLDQKVMKLLPSLAQKKNTESTIDSLVNIATLIQKEAFDVGKKSAAVEMKVKVPPTNKAIIEVMKKSNRKIIEKIVADINNSLTEKGFSEEGIVKQFLSGFKTLFVYGSINMWRETIFEKYPEKIYAFQYSAILDWRTTPLCSSLDDMVVSPDDPKRMKFNPPNHWNCRSIWVEILQDEDHKPPLQSKVADDPKRIMSKYKDNSVNIGIADLTKKVVEEEGKPMNPEFDPELYDTSVVQILNKETWLVDFYSIPKGKLSFYQKEIDDKIAGKNIDWKIYRITAFNPKNGFEKFLKNKDFIYQWEATKEILPK